MRREVQGLDAASGRGYRVSVRREVSGTVSGAARNTGYRVWKRREIQGTGSGYGKIYKVQGLDTARSTRYRVWIRREVQGTGSGYGERYVLAVSRLRREIRRYKVYPIRRGYLQVCMH